MARVLITGASGLLGIHLALRAAGEHTVTGVVNTRGLPGAPFRVAAADLSGTDAVTRLLDETRPEILFHCAALTHLDAVEAEPERAEWLNAGLPGLLAAECAQRGTRLVHISTDAVFDGARPYIPGDGYTEADLPNPLSVYARTKLDGEQAVLSANPQAAVARVNFYGWSLTGRRSLGEFFFNNLSAGQRINGFTDVMFCPLLVTDLADILLEMARRGLNGVYHTVSSEAVSKYEFGCRLARHFGLDESLITPIRVSESGLKAARSPNLALNTSKLTAALGRALPEIDAGLERFAQEYHSGLPNRLQKIC
ncbi:MAG: SDR family oxidoreductase [Longilinea sp.]|nr:SDR family oxidoreductase [Longilinea sp.]